MFGFAIWDSSRRRLMLARDRVGKKPLYYTRVDGNLIFASEIKSLLCHPNVKREADVQALADYLSVRYVPAPATLFANVKVQSRSTSLGGAEATRASSHTAVAGSLAAQTTARTSSQGPFEHVHQLMGLYLEI